MIEREINYLERRIFETKLTGEYEFNKTNLNKIITWTKTKNTEWTKAEIVKNIMRIVKEFVADDTNYRGYSAFVNESGTDILNDTDCSYYVYMQRFGDNITVTLLKDAFESERYRFILDKD